MFLSLSPLSPPPSSPSLSQPPQLVPTPGQSGRMPLLASSQPRPPLVAQPLPYSQALPPMSGLHTPTQFVAPQVTPNFPGNPQFRVPLQTFMSNVPPTMGPINLQAPPMVPPQQPQTSTSFSTRGAGRKPKSKAIKIVNPDTMQEVDVSGGGSNSVPPPAPTTATGRTAVTAAGFTPESSAADAFRQKVHQSLKPQPAPNAIIRNPNSIPKPQEGDALVEEGRQMKSEVGVPVLPSPQPTAPLLPASEDRFPASIFPPAQVVASEQPGMGTGGTGFVPEPAPSLSSLASVGQIPSEVIADGFQPPTVPLAPPMATPTTLTTVLPPHGPPAANGHAILPQTEAQLPAAGGEEEVVPTSESTDSPSLIPSVPSHPEPSHLPTDDVAGGDAMPKNDTPSESDQAAKPGQDDVAVPQSEPTTVSPLEPTTEPHIEPTKPAETTQSIGPQKETPQPVAAPPAPETPATSQVGSASTTTTTAESKPPPVSQDEGGKGEPPVAPAAPPAATATLIESQATPTATPPTTSPAAEDEPSIPERSRTPPPESVAMVTKEGAAVPGEADSEREETQPAAATSTPQPSPPSSPKPPTEVCN